MTSVVLSINLRVLTGIHKAFRLVSIIHVLLVSENKGNLNLMAAVGVAYYKQTSALHFQIF